VEIWSPFSERKDSLVSAAATFCFVSFSSHGKDFHGDNITQTSYVTFVDSVRSEDACYFSRLVPHALEHAYSNLLIRIFIVLLS